MHGQTVGRTDEIVNEGVAEMYLDFSGCLVLLWLYVFVFVVARVLLAGFCCALAEKALVNDTDLLTCLCVIGMYPFSTFVLAAVSCGSLSGFHKRQRLERPKKSQ